MRNNGQRTPTGRNGDSPSVQQILETMTKFQPPTFHAKNHCGASATTFSWF